MDDLILVSHGKNINGFDKFDKTMGPVLVGCSLVFFPSNDMNPANTSNKSNKLFEHELVWLGSWLTVLKGVERVILSAWVILTQKDIEIIENIHGFDETFVPMVKGRRIEFYLAG